MLQNNLVNGEIVVPAGKYFVADDARGNSFDSRNWGFVSSADIIGRPEFIYDSLAPDPSDVGQPQPAHPPVRRWDRVFKVL
jgi:signal peptidase I